MSKGTILNKISEELLIPRAELEYLIASAPHRYKVYKIPKRKKNKYRTIAQPSREVKTLQYWVLTNILNKFPVHPSAMAYAKGRNIAQNAQTHEKNPYLIKFDFTDFFPSIKAHDFKKYICTRKEKIFSDVDLDRLAKILFWKPKGQSELLLSIGAPTSPCLSNIIMNDFDNKITKICEKENALYTRYADDLAISMQSIKCRKRIYKAVIDTIKLLDSPKLEVNKEKTVFTSKANRRRITGLIISNDGCISLGRERKRQISAMIHHFKLGKLSNDEVSKLQGLLAFARDIEPAFIGKMTTKYNKEVINKIIKYA